MMPLMSLRPSSALHLVVDLRQHAFAEGVVAALLDGFGGEAVMRDLLQQAHLFGVGPRLETAQLQGSRGLALSWVDHQGRPLLDDVESLPRRRHRRRKGRVAQHRPDRRRQASATTAAIEHDDEDAQVLHIAGDAPASAPTPLADDRQQRWLDGQAAPLDDVIAHLQQTKLPPRVKMPALRTLHGWRQGLRMTLGHDDVAVDGREGLRALCNAVALAGLVQEHDFHSVRIPTVPRAAGTTMSSWTLGGFDAATVEQWAQAAAPEVGHCLDDDVVTDPLAAAFAHVAHPDALPPHQVRQVGRGALGGIGGDAWVWVQGVVLSPDTSSAAVRVTTRLPTTPPSPFTPLLQAGARQVQVTPHPGQTAVDLSCVVDDDNVGACTRVLAEAGATRWATAPLREGGVERTVHRVPIGADGGAPEKRDTVRIAVHKLHHEVVYTEVDGEDVRQLASRRGLTPTSIEEEARMRWRALSSTDAAPPRSAQPEAPPDE